MIGKLFSLLTTGGTQRLVSIVFGDRTLETAQDLRRHRPLCLSRRYSSAFSASMLALLSARKMF